MKCILALPILFTMLIAPVAEAQDTSVTFFTWREHDKKMWDVINKKNLIPGVNVIAKPINRDFYELFIKLQLQNNSAEFFLWKPGASNLQELIQHDFIAPFENDLSMMNESAIVAALGADGRHYGVPFAIQLQSIIVNKKLVEQHGISQAPRTMEELTIAFEKLKSAGVTPIHIAGGANWYVAQVLAEVLVAGLINERFTEELISGSRCFTDNKYQIIFEVLDSWVKSGFTNSDAATADYGVMSKEVGIGNSAMSIEGGWMIGPTSMFYNIDASYQFDFWSIPGVSNKVYALGDGTYQVAKGSRKSKALNKVLNFTTTRQFAELFAQEVNELPAYGLEMTIEPSVLKDMADKAVNKSYSISLFNAYEINAGEPSYNSLVTDALKGILEQSKTPSQATKFIQQGLNSWGYPGATQCN